MSTAMNIKDLTVVLNKKEVLSNINLTLSEGSFLGIVGPNGSGKTTLLRVVLGILSPSAGEVLVFGDTPQELQGTACSAIAWHLIWTHPATHRHGMGLHRQRKILGK